MTALVNIGKYRVLNQLATGGMGEVFLARHEGPAGFTKVVVVKRILPHLARDKAFVKMFLNEARLAAMLEHPNVVQIFELAEEAGTWFIAMEPVLGHSLREVSDRMKEQARAFPPQQLARICAQVLSGLHYAHGLRDSSGQPLDMVHRDVSPENVMIGFNGAVKLLDFGIAKAASSMTDPTRIGAVKGKYAYMSPEQLRGEELDGRSDVWSVGVIMYELLAGHRPFAALVDAELARDIETKAHVPLVMAAPDAPDELSNLIEKALVKDRSKRWPTAEAFGTALERWLEGQRTSLTNSQTATFMRELYGPEADQVLQSVSTSGRLLEQKKPQLYLSSGGEGHTAVNPVKPRSRGLIFGAVAAVLLVFTVGLVVMLLTPDESSPPPKKVSTQKPPPDVSPAADAGAAAVAKVTPPPEPVGNPPPDSDRPAPEDATPLDAKARKRGVGTVDLRVSPWAEVYEGRKRIGVTPMAPFELPVGRHVVTLKNPQLGVTRQVTCHVKKGARVTLKVELAE